MRVDAELSSDGFYSAFVLGGVAFYASYPRNPEKPFFNSLKMLLKPSNFIKKRILFPMPPIENGF